jgi:uncharacterized membrane protein YcaP (DUF421 family)
VGAYASLLIFLRVSGKRSTGKLNLFDWVVTVALGSMLATTILSQDTPLVVGIAGFAALLGLQFMISWLSVRSAFVRGLVKAQPKLLFHQGEYLEQNMRRERITRDEVQAAAREEGLASLDDVAAVVLETNAVISVIEKRPPSDHGILEGVATPRVDDEHIGREPPSREAGGGKAR